MAERVVGFRVGARRLTLRGAHDPYLDPIAGRDFASDPLARLAGALPPEATILDVGANVGLTTLILATICPRARIVAFEPMAENVRLLERNLRENGVGTCTVVGAAVGDGAGTVAMTADGPWSLVSAAGAAVPLVTLDDWCARSLPEARIELVKIDVEGYEPNVLAGARALVRRWNPTILLEFNSWTLLLQGHNPLAFAAFLWSAFAVSGAGGEAFSDAREFVFGNLMERRCVDDLVLRPRPAPESSSAEAIWHGLASTPFPRGIAGPGLPGEARGIVSWLRRRLRPS